MASRKLRVIAVNIEECTDESKQTRTILHIEFSRKLTALEVSGVEGVLSGQIK